jgi:circadian clock protein KaiC
MHLLTIHNLVNQFRPRIVIIDPITNFAALGNEAEIKAMLTQLIDFFKMKQITILLTTLTGGGSLMESSEVGVSSLIDTWLLLRDLQNGAEWNRALYILKSRGMAHSNQIREFLLTDHGMELQDVYIGPSGVLLTGSARMTLEAQEKAQALVRDQEIGGKNRELERKRQAMEARIAMLRADFEIEQVKAEKTIGQDQTRAEVVADERVQMALLRQSDASGAGKTPRHK